MKICQVYEKQCLDLNGQETIIINIILTKFVVGNSCSTWNNNNNNNNNNNTIIIIQSYLE